MRRTVPVLTMALVVATGGVAFGGTLQAPADFETLQDAVDAARDGDHSVVATGRHHVTAEVRDEKRLRNQGAEGAILGFVGCTGVRISRLRLRYGQRGAIVTDSVGVSFEGCEVPEKSGEAAYAHGAPNVSFADGHIQRVGVGVATVDTTNRVKGPSNRIEVCSRNATLAKGDRCVISGNAARGCGNDGIGIRGDRNEASDCTELDRVEHGNLAGPNTDERIAFGTTDLDAPP